MNSVLMIAVSWVVLGFIALLGATVIGLIWKGKIKLDRLISESNGDASMSRFQLLVFTFVIAGSFFLITASKAAPAFPDPIPQGVLLLLGISSSSYLVSKGIQMGSDAGMPGVTVGPATAHATVGGPGVQFTAKVARADDQGVVWSVDGAGGGTVSNTGLYTPPAAVPAGVNLPTTVTVKATSKADPTAFDTGAVILA
jgi:hypothetical protein